ncbi:3'-5' exonuclease [Deinococcus aquaedulcis]|uniref:3'-5' exonuclease n=1 Tax=Deinococcus aquaedulcis TaxID=2840455 RepID=UPI002E2B8F5E|nr:3'-5' exonuclease [Deinococcus aquaedulcis]
MATVRYGRRGRYQETVLYDRAQAVPRPQATPAQLAALEKAGQVRKKHEQRRREEEAAQLAQDEADWQAWLDDQAAQGRAALREIVARGNWVTLDTETTELDCPEVVEIAVVAPGGEVLHQSLVRPVGLVSEGARAVHGITDTELATAPGWPEVWAQVRPHIEGKELVAWNAGFDQDAMQRSSRLQGLELPDLDWRCAMSAAAPIWGEWSDYWDGFRYVSLAEACWREGVQVSSPAHRATGDAQRVAALLVAITTTAEPQ